MANFANNYGKIDICPLCYSHPDVQSYVFECKSAREKIGYTVNYSEIFGSAIEPELASRLEKVYSLRDPIPLNWLTWGIQFPLHLFIS